MTVWRRSFGRNRSFVADAPVHSVPELPNLRSRDAKGQGRRSALKRRPPQSWISLVRAGQSGLPGRSRSPQDRFCGRLDAS